MLTIGYKGYIGEVKQGKTGLWLTVYSPISGYIETRVLCIKESPLDRLVRYVQDKM